MHIVVCLVLCECFLFKPLGESMDMKKLLFEATLEGNVSSLLGLLKEDPLILDRYTILNPYNETPLHVASMLGHLDFVREILTQKPKLASELNSKGSSPLHMASEKGYVEIVKELVLVSPDMCLARDSDGLNPVHLAAMKGRIDVLKELLRVRVHAARAMANRGETILHLCVKYNQLEALKLLVESLSDYEFVNSKDDDGHTILHVAVANKQIETIKFLLQNTSIIIKVNERNGDGVTAMGVLARSPRDTNDKDIKESLTRAGAYYDVNRNNSQQAQIHTENLLNRRDLTLLESPASNKEKVKNKGPEKHHKWLEKKQSSLMVVASLIATMAFQVGVNPPGGVWQEFKNNNNSDSSSASPPGGFGTEIKEWHIPGTSIMADFYPEPYRRFIIANTISFIASLSIILLLISGLPIKRRVFIFILMVIMWIAVTATSFTYILSLVAVAPATGSWNTLLHVVGVAILVWIGLMGILILTHTIRIIIKGLRKLKKYYSQRRGGGWSWLSTNNDGV